jgi:hypothetical protein
MTALAALALGLAGCGGSDSHAFVGSGSGTGGTGTGTGTGGSATFSMGSGTGSSFKAGMLAISSPMVSAGGTTTISASIVDKTGTLLSGTAVTVVFNSPCVANGTATITGPVGSTLPAGSVSTSTGIAQATYTAKGCSGTDVITATATVTNPDNSTSTLTATGTVTVAAGAVGSIQFVSATPSTIGLKGTGLNETSTVVFKVVDSSGGPRAGVAVTFALNTSVGGVKLAPASATSGSDGLVQTVVSSGTAHTSVRVTATIASPALSTESSVLAITTGLPASNSFSIATGMGSSGNACPNVEAYNVDGVTIPIVVRLADRYNNPAPDGTAVAFTTDGGHVVGNCTTPSAAASAGDGTCTATWTSADPRPQPANDNPPIKEPGRVKVLATAIGEESFTDVNGNGFYDTGEPFTNLGEPFRDDNESGNYELGEYFLDFNHDGIRTPPDGVFKGITCTAGSSPTCSTTTLAIGAATTIVMSTGGAIITEVSGFINPYALNSNNALVFNVKDLNNNPLPAGTIITVSASSTLGTISQGSFTTPCSTVIGGQTLTSFLTGAAAAGAGNVTITVVSPTGVTTVHNFSSTVN